MKRKPIKKKKKDLLRTPPKVCKFCKGDVKFIDYKDTELLRKYMTDRGKIKPARVTGTCRQHQNDLANAIKRARIMALLPYSIPVVTNRGRRR